MSLAYPQKNVVRSLSFLPRAEIEVLVSFIWYLYPGKIWEDPEEGLSFRVRKGLDLGSYIVTCVPKDDCIPVVDFLGDDPEHQHLPVPGFGEWRFRVFRLVDSTLVRAIFFPDVVDSEDYYIVDFVLKHKAKPLKPFWHRLLSDSF